MSLRPMSKMKNFNFFSLGEPFVVKILGSGGSIMYHKTFGNMKHPIVLEVSLNLYNRRIVSFS